MSRVQICHLCDRCVRKFRSKGNVYVCSADKQRRDILELTVLGQCALERFGGAAALAPATLRTARARRPCVSNGAELWGKIHRWAMFGEISRPGLMLQEIFALLGTKGNCAEHSRRWVLEHPPRIASREDAFAWTVEWHNAVNERTGAEVMSVEDARQRWG